MRATTRTLQNLLEKGCELWVRTLGANPWLLMAAVEDAVTTTEEAGAEDAVTTPEGDPACDACGLVVFMPSLAAETAHSRTIE